MALDDISCDFGGMTRSKVVGYAEASPDGLEISRLLDRDGKPGVFDMSHPTRAAPAIWILMDKNLESLGGGERKWHDQCRS